MFLRSYDNRFLCWQGPIFRVLCSKGPMFSGFYIHRVLCFPKTYVPRFICFHSCISQGPMLTESYVPMNQYSLGPMFLETCAQGSKFSQRLVFRGSECSEGPGPRDLCFQILCSQWAMFKESCSQGPVFPKIYVFKVIWQIRQNSRLDQVR